MISKRCLDEMARCRAIARESKKQDEANRDRLVAEMEETGQVVFEGNEFEATLSQGSVSLINEGLLREILKQEKISLAKANRIITGSRKATEFWKVAYKEKAAKAGRKVA